MNILEYNAYLYGTAPAEKDQNALGHSGVKGQEWYKRRYQNLDGSLTPLGRMHYGVGAPREEREAAEEAERRRQEEIDYNRSKSIREMDDDELQAAVARSRMETQFEQNMQNRAVNFMQSQVTEEQLKQQYDDLMYQRSRQKAERFMERVERLARFGGNLASAYGKVVDVKGKIEDVRAKRNLADQEQWKAEQQRTKFEEGEWNFGKKKSEYNMSLQNKLNSLKSDLDEMSGDNKQKSKKELKAEAKAAKKAGKMSDSDYDKTVEFWEKEAEAARKSGDKVKEYNAKAMAADAKSRKGDKKDQSDFKPTYEKKVGDKYVYGDDVKKNWDSEKETKKSGILSKVFGGKNSTSKISQNVNETPKSDWSYFNRKKEETPKSDWSAKSIYERQENREKNLGFLNSYRLTGPDSAYRNMGKGTSSQSYDWAKAMEKSKEYNPKRNSESNGGKIYTDAAWKRRKKRGK